MLKRRTFCLIGVAAAIAPWFAPAIVRKRDHAELRWGTGTTRCGAVAGLEALVDVHTINGSDVDEGYLAYVRMYCDVEPGKRIAFVAGKHEWELVTVAC